MSNYPIGAKNDPNAPYNQKEVPPVKVNVCASITLSRNTTIETTDYTREDVEEWDTDEGYPVFVGGTNYDFSECDFKKEYEEQEYTPLDLLKLLEDRLKGEIKSYKLIQEMTTDKKEKARIKGILPKLQRMLECTQGWTIDELEVIKEG